MLALTLSQPFASAIVDGPKRTENRPWRRTLPPGGLWIAIHAGVGRYDWGDRAEEQAAAEMGRLWPGMPPWEGLTRGAFLGVAHVREIVAYDDLYTDVRQDPWAFGPWCWRLDQAISLPEPIPCRGALGLWRVPEGIEARIRAACPGVEGA